MSNIHTFRDLEVGTSSTSGRRPNPPTSASSSSSSSWRPFAPSSSSWGSSNPAPPPNYGTQNYLVEEQGVSMVSAPFHADGTPPTAIEQCCPRIAFPTLTTLLCIVDTILFVATLIVGSAKYDGAFVQSNDLGGPSGATLLAMGGKYYPLIKHDGEVWRLITPIFLHAGLIHLFSNLLFFMRIGYVLEIRLGLIRYSSLYLLAGIAASLWSCVLGSPTMVSVGASGAIFGLVGADLGYLAYNWLAIPQASQEAIILMVMVLVNFLIGISPGVDNYAHLGGLVNGLFLGLWLQKPLIKRENGNWYQIGGAVIFWGLFLSFILLLWVGNPWPGY